MSLEGKHAFVTGSSGGIGAATAIELARQGAVVAVHGFRNRDGAAATARAVADARRQSQAAPVVLGDLSKAAEARTVVQAAIAALGRIDVLVNAAGDLIQRRPLVEMTDELWGRVMDANLSSALFCSQAAAPGMVERRSGAIVNLSSLAAWNGGGPGALAYAAAKGALVSLSKAMAKELAPHGVRVNCVSPGLIDTPIRAAMPEAARKEMLAKAAAALLVKRVGEGEDIAMQILAFMANGFASGSIVYLDGGALAT